MILIRDKLKNYFTVQYVTRFDEGVVQYMHIILLVIIDGVR